MNIIVLLGLFIIFLAVLLLPFRVKRVEENLEPFLFVCGVAALTISGFYTGLTQNGESVHTGWSLAIVKEALIAPVYIHNKLRLPVGIVQAVLLVGLVMYKWHKPIHKAIRKMADRLSAPLMAFLLIVVLGLVSSIISAILAALILVETVAAMPLARRLKIDLTVITCFSIGLGAALTPLGEPLSTIAVTKLAGAPYHAGFGYLAKLLGVYIVPGVIAFGLLGVLFLKRSRHLDSQEEDAVYKDKLKDVILRAAKVYLFIMALVFLGDGFKPIIIKYISKMPAEALYWVNTVSAILDNATLTAAEIGPTLNLVQIKGALMGLLIAGGMLIPGNIPNIIAAGKLGIKSKEWAGIGVQIGLATMFVYFLILYLPHYF
ncbi:MAG: cation transporter [Candidatus Aminicenantes bacterium RBG_16_63_16]|nr:MAG: cation transporter [Candidatus Aminicenantes bacterium RBG_16_63_16]